jgi:hypothetical protein
MGWPLALAIISLVLAVGSAYMASQAAGDIGISDSGKDRGQQVTTRSTDRELCLPYGRCRVYVNEVFIDSSGTDKKYLHIVGTLGEGPISGIVQQDGTVWDGSGSPSDIPLVFLDDVLYSEYGSLVHLEFFRGTATQSVCSTLAGSVSAWEHPMRYTAYIYLRLEFDRDKWQGKPSEIAVIVEGLEVYDPETETTAYSNNPALAARDFITRSSRRGGMEIASTRLLDTTFTTVKTRCASKGWTANLPIRDKDAKAADNLQLILNCFRGGLIFSENVYKLRYKDLNFDEDESVMSIDEDDIIDGSMRVRQPDAFDRPNAIRAKYYNEEGATDGTGKYMEADYVLAPEDLVTADGDYREKEVQLWGLTALAKVQAMANYHLERARLNKTASLDARERACLLEPWDIIDLTYESFGWAAKLFRVEAPTLKADDTVALGLLEEATILYDDTYNLTSHDWHDTTLPDPGAAVPSVVNVSHAEEVYYYRNRSFTRWKIDFEGPAATTYPWWDYAEIWVKIGTAGDWRFMTKSGGDYALDPVEEGETYYCKMVSVSLHGAKEDFDDAYTVSKEILGKTAAPTSLAAMTAVANGDSVNVFAQAVTDPDIEGYEVRLGDSWDGGIFISFNKAPNIRLTGVHPGLHTFWMSPKDNAGNYSGTPVSATVKVFLPQGYTELPTYGSWVWDYSTGTHNNTVQQTTSPCSVGDPCLKGSHTGGVLTGTWTSPTYDLGAVEIVRVWGNFITTFESSETTWDGVLPLVLTGSELVTDGEFENWTSDDLDDWSESNADAAETSGETGSAAQVTTSAASGYIYQNFAVTAGKWYRLSGRYKNAAGDVAAFGLYDVTNSAWITPDALKSLEDNESWADFNHIFEAPTGCASVQIRLGSPNNGDVVTFEAVTVKEIDETNSTTWEDVEADEKTWNEIFQPSEAGQLRATLQHKVLSGDEWSEVDYFEILCAEVEAQYLRVVIEIVDPTADSHLYVQELSMYAYEGATEV